MDEKRNTAQKAAYPRQFPTPYSRMAHPPLPLPERGARVQIHRQARSTMQSGTVAAQQWVIEFEPAAREEVEPLMGWTASRDPGRQVRLLFPSRRAAVAFAERNGWRFTVWDQTRDRPKPKSYAKNFPWLGEQPPHRDGS